MKLDENSKNLFKINTKISYLLLMKFGCHMTITKINHIELLKCTDSHLWKHLGDFVKFFKRFLIRLKVYSHLISNVPQRTEENLTQS